MKVLLIKDVYKLGRAGDVKRVANGYGRNYLLPEGMAVLATPGALKRVETIRTKASAERTVLNSEMSGVAEKINGAYVAFGVKAGETGKLYGSITTAMIAEELSKKAGVTIDRHQIDTQPIRNLGEFKAEVRLTVDLVPEIKILVHREGEAVELPGAEAEIEATEPVEVASEEAGETAADEAAEETSAA